MVGETQPRSGIIGRVTHSVLHEAFFRGVTALYASISTSEQIPGEIKYIDTAQFGATRLPRGRSAILRGVLPCESSGQGASTGLVSLEVSSLSAQSTIYSLKGTLNPWEMNRWASERREVSAEDIRDALNDSTDHMDFVEPDLGSFQVNGRPLTGLRGLREAWNFNDLVLRRANDLESLTPEI